jgi:hypothetical protein
MTISHEEFVKQYDELYQDTLDWVESTALPDAAPLDERYEYVREIMALLELAYDKGFTNAEYQDSGYSGVSGWTNFNPYRKKP